MSPRQDGLPRLLVLVAAAGVAFFALPLVGLLARAPWGEAVARLHQPGGAAGVAAVPGGHGRRRGAQLVGGPAGGLAAGPRAFRGRTLVRAVVLLPVVLPPVVGGVALLAAYGRRGLLGGLGLALPFTTLGAVVAATFVAAPFLILTVEAGLAGLDRRLEDAAASLGAGRWLTWRAVILPALRPALVAGTALAAARALGEFGATITFAGNRPGQTQTLPLAVYVLLQTDPDAAILLSLLLVVVSVALLALAWSRLGADGRGP